MKQSKVQKGKLIRVIGLYFLCLLAAFLTWIAVMYTEEKNAAQSGESGEKEETVSLFSYDDRTSYAAVMTRDTAV